MKLMPAFVWRVKTSEKKIFLTFDDGPHPSITPWILDELKKHDAKGTFFCVGDNVRKFPETYQQILNEKHRTGNHTFNHLKGWQTKNETYYDNIEKAAELIKSDLFRPPYGRISFSQTRKLKQQYKLIMWDILTCDYNKNLNTEKALQDCLRLVQNGSVIVFHDSEKAEKNLKIMLPVMLKELSRKGFSFETL